jgi:hypothetical protein
MRIGFGYPTLAELKQVLNNLEKCLGQLTTAS